MAFVSAVQAEMTQYRAKQKPLVSGRVTELRMHWVSVLVVTPIQALACESNAPTRVGTLREQLAAVWRDRALSSTASKAS